MLPPDAVNAAAFFQFTLTVEAAGLTSSAQVRVCVGRPRRHGPATDPARLGAPRRARAPWCCWQIVVVPADHVTTSVAISLVDALSTSGLPVLSTTQPARFQSAVSFNYPELQTVNTTYAFDWSSIGAYVRARRVWGAAVRSLTPFRVRCACVFARAPTRGPSRRST